jgi:hypothetical protein
MQPIEMEAKTAAGVRRDQEKMRDSRNEKRPLPYKGCIRPFPEGKIQIFQHKGLRQNHLFISNFFYTLF